MARKASAKRDESCKEKTVDKASTQEFQRRLSRVEELIAGLENAPRVGRTRVVDMLSGEQLPRIC